MVHQWCVLFSLLLVLNADIARTEKDLLVPPISDTCLSCICEASSGCNATIGCTHGFCGPYLISQPYWNDAKSDGIPPPTVQGQINTDDWAYEHCTKDANCASETVRRYGSRFGQDCDGNGVIDCVDFALIHKNGGYNCKTPLNPASNQYYYKFLVCASEHADLGVTVPQTVLDNPPPNIDELWINSPALHAGHAGHSQVFTASGVPGSSFSGQHGSIQGVESSGFHSSGFQTLPKNDLPVPPISETCLSCICEASSGCNTTIGCTHGFCGPYLISQPYWNDAKSDGIPPPTVPGQINTDDWAYEHCTKDTNCAAETVRRYGSRFGQDCDGNGVIDCVDFALIHKNGGYDCKTPLDPATNQFYYTFLVCASKHTDLGIHVPQTVLDNPPSNINELWR